MQAKNTLDQHDRMPAILSFESVKPWLNSRTDRFDLLKILTPFPASKMKTYPVSSRVNSPEYDAPELLAKVETELGRTLSLF